MFDPDLYRAIGGDRPVARTLIPIDGLRRAAWLRRGWLDERRPADIGPTAEAEIDDAVAFAERATLEPVDDLGGTSTGAKVDA